MGATRVASRIAVSRSPVHRRIAISRGQPPGGSCLAAYIGRQGRVELVQPLPEYGGVTQQVQHGPDTGRPVPEVDA
jgi:hypothetical protein